MAEERRIHTEPRGEPTTIKQAVLATGSKLLQSSDPLKGFDIYVVGFHPAKDDPQMQMEAHHFCRQVNADFIQCVLFDGNTEDANLIGIEYIASERLFGELPAEERKYWHPHNYEILSGTLVAPGLPEAAEHAMMSTLMNSYGKTFHTWHTGRHDQPRSGDTLPLGDPHLMWSFNRDGELNDVLVRDRDRRMGIDTQAKRQSRRDLARHAHPQHGVDAMQGAFPAAEPEPPEGVQQAAD